MKKGIVIIWLVLCLVFLSACSVGNIATSTTSEQASSESAGSLETSAAPEATVASVATVQAENAEVDESDSDYVYDSAAATPIVLNGNSIASEGSGVTVAGSTATIAAAGTYTLSGTLENGQIILDTQDEEVVQLILNGVEISNASGAAINVVNAERTVILLAEGTVNTVSDGTEYVFAIPDETEPNAAIFSKNDLTLAGNGTLTVTGNYNDGIASKDGLIIAGGTITVSAVDDGVRGKDYVVLKSGSLSITASGDGLKSDDAEDPTKGYILIEDGDLTVVSGGNAIQAETDVTATGGEINLTAGGGSGNRASVDESMKGISANVSISIDGGNFTIDSADDAVHSNGSITINGGALALSSGDDGVHADVTLAINGGDVSVSQSYEGLESAVILINAGQIEVTSSDDGINVAGGADGSGMGRQGWAQDTFATGSQYLAIHGGWIVVNASGDGVDANGSVEMTDGVLVVNGPTEQMNSALDYDGGFALSGGFVVAAGSSGMAMPAGSTGEQNSVMVFFDNTLQAGTLVHIQNSAGEDILTFAPTKDFQSLAFTSATLVSGETYTIYTGGSASGTPAGGLYVGGEYSGGSEYTSFTAGGVVTLGTGGGMGGPGGGRRRP